MVGMNGWLKLLLQAVLLPMLVGCSLLPSPKATLTPQPSASPTLTPVPTQEVVPTPVAPTTLRIWLPPQFDPNGESIAAGLLQARLDEFASRRGGVHIEARIKASKGAGGLLDSLSATSAAAPAALPDLILLPHATLEVAALKGLLYPFDGQTDSLLGDDWYGFALRLARLQNSTFGLPFAGDALILLYRPARVSEPPRDWASVLSMEGALVYPAADEQALFTLTQYLAAGGEIQDAEGRPKLDEDTLTEVLTFYQQASAAGVMPVWLTQYSTDQQTWEAYTGNRADLAISWVSRYLVELPADTSATPIPTPNGNLLTLADGWVWALANPQVERHALAVELAEFLTDSDFLASWTFAAGYLPPRTSAVASWTDATLRTLVDRVAVSAQIIPSNDVMIALSPALQEATLKILKEQADPASAAQDAVTKATGP